MQYTHRKVYTSEILRVGLLLFFGCAMIIKSKWRVVFMDCTPLNQRKKVIGNEEDTGHAFGACDVAVPLRLQQCRRT